MAARYGNAHKSRQLHGFDNERPHEYYLNNIQNYSEMGRWVDLQLVCHGIVMAGPALLGLAHFVGPSTLAPPLAQGALPGHPSK